MGVGVGDEIIDVWKLFVLFKNRKQTKINQNNTLANFDIYLKIESDLKLEEREVLPSNF